MMVSQLGEPYIPVIIHSINIFRHLLGQFSWQLCVIQHLLKVEAMDRFVTSTGYQSCRTMYQWRLFVLYCIIWFRCIREAIKFKYTPYYSTISGTGNGVMPIFSVNDTGGSVGDLVIWHDANGLNATASNITITSAWTWTVGTEYEIEFDYNFTRTGGANYLFVNGLQLATGSYGNNITTGTGIYIGYPKWIRSFRL